MRVALREITDALSSLTACRAVIEDYDRHPWRGCCIASFSLTLQDDITHDFQRLSQAISGCAESVAILSHYGFTSAQPSKSELETALEQAKRLLQFPELPGQWFAHNPREIASRLAELQSAVARCQELWQELAAFRREIVGTDFKTLVTEVCEQSSPWLKRLCAAPPRTVRTQQEWFAALADELAEVRQLVGEIAATVEDFSQALRVRVDKDSSLGLLTKLTALGSVLRQTGLLKPSWFDDAKRAELQQVAIKCQKQIDEANRLRTCSFQTNERGGL